MKAESNYKIIKDILSKKILNTLDKTIFKSDFSWYYNEYTVNESPKKYKNSYDHFQFSHWIVRESKPNSPISPLLEELIKPLPFKYTQIVRAKLNFLPQYKIEKNRDKHNIPHIDIETRHKVAIIYLDNSDGFTYLFNKDNIIFKKVKPKRGKVLLFKGCIKHAGSHPIDSKKRVLLNIDYIE